MKNLGKPLQNGQRKCVGDMAYIATLHHNKLIWKPVPVGTKLHASILRKNQQQKVVSFRLTRQQLDSLDAIAKRMGSRTAAIQEAFRLLGERYEY
jgi:hypothetical protein